MATYEKRGRFWRVKIRRRGLPAQSRTFPSKALAERWARSVDTDIDQGMLVDRRAADHAYLAEVLERCRREISPSKRGARDEDLRLKAMAMRPFARIRMAALRSSHLAAYRDERLRVVCGGTVNREFNVLSHAIETARREWEIHLPVNPCTLVRRPPQGRPRNRRLLGDEESRVFGALTAEALKLSFKRALRRAGITNLRLHDLRHEATSRFFEKGLNVMEVATATGA